jgi:two-component system response regulator AtoC
MDSPLSSGNPEANQGTAPAPAKRPVDRGEKKFPSLKEAARRAVEQTERALIEDALNYTLWNRRKAAKLLDISYSSLLRRIDAYDIGQNETE